MRKLVYPILSLFLLNCNSIITENTETEELEEVLKDTITPFDKCFTKPKSNAVDSVIGCSGGYYKVISDEYVLRITSDLNVEYDDCTLINIDSADHTFIAQLLIFEKGKASLTNICTDLNNVNAAIPIKTLNKCYGQLVIGKSDPTDYYGNEMPKLTIQVDNITFMDAETKKTISVENELFWKVLNRGTPG